MCGISSILHLILDFPLTFLACLEDARVQSYTKAGTTPRVWSAMSGPRYRVLMLGAFLSGVSAKGRQLALNGQVSQICVCVSFPGSIVGSICASMSVRIFVAAQVPTWGLLLPGVPRQPPRASYYHGALQVCADTRATCYSTLTHYMLQPTARGASSGPSCASTPALASIFETLRKSDSGSACCRSRRTLYVALLLIISILSVLSSPFFVVLYLLDVFRGGNGRLVVRSLVPSPLSFSVCADRASCAVWSAQ